MEGLANGRLSCVQEERLSGGSSGTSAEGCRYLKAVCLASVTSIPETSRWTVPAVSHCASKLQVGVNSSLPPRFAVCMLSWLSPSVVSLHTLLALCRSCQSVLSALSLVSLYAVLKFFQSCQFAYWLHCLPVLQVCLVSWLSPSLVSRYCLHCLPVLPICLQFALSPKIQVSILSPNLASQYAACIGSRSCRSVFTFSQSCQSVYCVHRFPVLLIMLSSPSPNFASLYSFDFFFCLAILCMSWLFPVVPVCLLSAASPYLANPYTVLTFSQSCQSALCTLSLLSSNLASLYTVLTFPTLTSLHIVCSVSHSCQSVHCFHLSPVLPFSTIT